MHDGYQSYAEHSEEGSFGEIGTFFRIRRRGRFF
jgi:hypothetical protein